MATPNLQELMARLERLEAENTALKARGTDNLFVNTIDNLTLKHRQLSPSGWATPTKSQNGQGYLRCANFPMQYFVSQDGTKIVLHTEIPASAREIQLFKDRFLMQQIVVAKRRQQDGQPTSTSAPSVPGASTPTPTSTPASTGGKTFASLSTDERNALVAEANSLLSTGLYPTLPEALASVLSAHKISK